MDAVAHSSAMAVFFESPFKQTSMIALSARLGVTEHILDCYHEQFSSMDHYRLWFANAQENNRLVVINPEQGLRYERIDQHDEYVRVAFRFGQTFFIGHDDEYLAGLEDVFGIKTVGPDDDIAWLQNKDGIAYEKAVRKGDKIDVAELKRFFASERKVVVFDKYLKPCTVETVAWLCEEMAENGVVRFYAGSHASIDKRRIVKAFEGRSDIKVSLKHVKATEKIDHDRYLFLGERIQVWMSNGLDALDLKKMRALSENRICVLNVSHDFDEGKIVPTSGRAELVRVSRS